jgi:hypothetical protein
VIRASFVLIGRWRVPDSNWDVIRALETLNPCLSQAAVCQFPPFFCPRGSEKGVKIAVKSISILKKCLF